MVYWFAQLDALGVVKVLFWGSVVMSLACFLTDRHLHLLLKDHWKPILFCVALTLLWRIPMEGGFFHGTEYEDSYVYTVAGRQIAQHFRIEPQEAALPYSINVCGVGSLTSCRKSTNFPEHLIGYPYILSVFSNIFGYRPSIGSIANVLCACFADILIFLLCMVIAKDAIAAWSAALIFAITPVFAVWGLETSAEPISNGCMSLVLLPVFLGSFFVVQWYGGAIILVLIGVVVAWRRMALELFPFLLFAAYVLLYAFHIRSYYEMLSGSTDSRSALRFSMNLMSMWSILAGLGTAHLLGWYRRSRTWKNHGTLASWIAVCVVVVALGVSYYATTYFREDVVEDEFRMRIEPSLTAARIATQDRTRPNYILTFEPLIPQMYAESDVKVLNADDLDGGVMREIGFINGVTSVLYVDEDIHRTPADAERYKSQLEYLNKFQQSLLTSNEVFAVVKITP
jgi:hypothetical protein